MPSQCFLWSPLTTCRYVLHHSGMFECSLQFFFFPSSPKHLQACRFIVDASRPVSTHRLMFVHVCCCGTYDLWVCRTPRLLAGGLSTHGGRADLIFHTSTALPWTPSLSPHGWLENCSANTWLKHVILPAPSPTCCSPTRWASQLKATDVGSCL